MTAQSVRIRKSQPEDISLLAEIIRRSFRDVAERFGLTPKNCPKHPSNCTKEWIENSFARGVNYYQLENKGIPAGCVAFVPATPDLCYLERLAVLPVNRRNGFGRALVEHVLQEARKRDVKQIRIGIIASDKPLKNWYRKIGFVENETKSFSYLPFPVTFMTIDL